MLFSGGKAEGRKGVRAEGLIKPDIRIQDMEWLLSFSAAARERDY